MKKHFNMKDFLFLLFVIPAFVFGQDTNFYYKNDVFRKKKCLYHKSDSTKVTGVIKQFHKYGQVEWEAYVFDGLINGEARRWCENGMLMEVKNFKNSRFDGEFKEWYCNGQLKMRGTMRNDQIIGTMYYWYKNGSPEREENYVDGKKEGLQKAYYENGHLKTEWNVFSDKLEGIYREYYKNGQLKSEIKYSNGKVDAVIGYYKRSDHPKREKYYSDGNPEIEIIYELGEMLVMKEWYSAHSGQPSSLMNEIKREGDIWRVKKEWYRDGTLMEVSYYNKKGESVGVNKRWYVNGFLKYESNYDENGKFISSKSWDVKGNPLD